MIDRDSNQTRKFDLRVQLHAIALLGRPILFVIVYSPIGLEPQPLQAWQQLRNESDEILPVLHDSHSVHGTALLKVELLNEGFLEWRDKCLVDDEVVLGIWQQSRLVVDLAADTQKLDVESDRIITKMFVRIAFTQTWPLGAVPRGRRLILGVAGSDHVRERLRALLFGGVCARVVE